MAGRSKAGWAVRLSILAVVVAAVAYVLAQRAAVRAGVDSLTFIDRVRGGFLCIGTCADKPGIMVLSRESREEVDVRAATESLFGRTTLTLDLGTHTEQHELDEPCVILLPGDGQRQIIAVDWDATTFTDVLAKTDCGGRHRSTEEHPNCGRPFLDLMEYLRANCPDRIPTELESFVRSMPDPLTGAP
ncbi:MAG TPA: hypothetical protein VM243_04485 [Phycisphaerae bacterium]|nr:hypothetical protein [Phycisphaerae bacterium]